MGDIEPGTTVLDAAVQYAQHIPVNVIARMLGFPTSDDDYFRRCVHEFLERVNEPIATREADGPRLDLYLDRQIEEHRANPRDDLTTFLLEAEIDDFIWAPGRIADYEASLTAELPPVLGVLEIPAVGLEVPVFSTSTGQTMDRGTGIIDGMAYPHEAGNIGISGHRDGYFRSLKDVQVGDKLVLQTLVGTKQFTIDTTRVVEISDTSVLQDTADQTLTLVTCYPFYFVGHAPQRFIVTASLDTTYVNQN